MSKKLKSIAKYRVSITIIGIVLVVVGIVIDILIKTNVLTAFIIVSDSYNTSVFSLIFTVATLGCTLLSIIVGASNNRVLGLKLREIVSLSNSPLQLKKMIIIILSMVMVSIPLLALDFNNAMTFLAIVLLLYTIYSTVILCLIVFDKEYTKEIVQVNLKEKLNIKPEYIQYWITALYSSLKENDIVSEEECLSLLKSAAESQKQFSDQIGKQVSQLFSESYKYQSFIDSYKRILRLNEPSAILFDERTITYNYIKNLRYADPKEIDKINLPGLVDSIIMCEYLNEEEKIFNCYWFFSAVLDNQNMDKTDRLSIVYNGFHSLFWLNDNYGFGNTRAKLAVLLFRDKVLLADDFEFGKKIYTRIIKAIYIRNRYHSSKPLASILSQMVRMLYFWSYLEVDTLSEERRSLISTIPTCIVETIDNASLSINDLIEEHHCKMVDFLVEDSLNDSWVDPLDYYSDIQDGKSLVCTPENKIIFAFWFYAIWGYGINTFPIKRDLSALQDKILLYKSVCVSVFQEFEISKELTQRAMQSIKKLQHLFHKPYQMPKHRLCTLYDEINNQIAQVNSLLSKAEKCTIPDICDELNYKMKEDAEIPLDESISLNQSSVFQLAPILCYKKADYISSIVYSLRSAITKIVNMTINKRLRSVILSFDKNGVITLKNELQNKTFSYRNYYFYDDWGIKQETRETQEYKELVKLIDSISYKNNPHLKSYVFLNLDEVKLNYSVEEMQMKDLDGEALENHLLRYRVADEQYLIDGAVYNKVSAVEHFKQTRFLLFTKIKVETNVQDTSGFKIEFDRKRVN